jgi:hypothetical protein
MCTYNQASGRADLPRPAGTTERGGYWPPESRRRRPPLDGLPGGGGEGLRGDVGRRFLGGGAGSLGVARAGGDPEALGFPLCTSEGLQNDTAETKGEREKRNSHFSYTRRHTYNVFFAFDLHARKSSSHSFSNFEVLN